MSRKKQIAKTGLLGFIQEILQTKSRFGVGASTFVKAKFITFIVLSVISAFINLIFLAGLTKTPYILGDTRGWYISIPAALFLGCLSIGLDISKALHVIQVNTLNNLARKLSDKTWSHRIRKVAKKWLYVYILYVTLSIITSVSLSSISIGSGITRNANLRDQVNEYIQRGEQYSGINNAAKDASLQNLISNATSTAEVEARQYATEKTNEINAFIDKITEINGRVFTSDEDSTAQQKKQAAFSQHETERQKINNILRNAGYRPRSFQDFITFDTSNIQAAIKKAQLDFLSNNTNDAAIAQLNKVTEATDVEILAWLETLNNLQLLNPKDNSVFKIEIDREKPASVLAKTAVTQLKALKVDIENDSGDIGISSKIFMQLGGFIQSLNQKDGTFDSVLTNSTRSSTFGPTEVMMMLMLLFLSLLCELGINQFSPEVSISRKMLAQFRRYYEKDFDVNQFMISIAVELRDYDLIDDETFNKEIEYAKMRIRQKSEIEDLIHGVIKEEFQYSSKVSDLVRELDSILES